MKHNVTFSTVDQNDDFGFVGNGSIELRADALIYSGPRSVQLFGYFSFSYGIGIAITLALFFVGFFGEVHWSDLPLWKSALSLLIGLFVSGLVLSFPVYILLLICSYFIRLKATVSLDRGSVSEFKRFNETIQFKVRASDAKTVGKTIFRFHDEACAAEFENELLGTSFPS